jgi:hypothetical protein
MFLKDLLKAIMDSEELNQEFLEGKDKEIFYLKC